MESVEGCVHVLNNFGVLKSARIVTEWCVVLSTVLPTA